MTPDQRWQLEMLRAGRRSVELDRPARRRDGIVTLSHERATAFEQQGRNAVAAGRVSKFVPASGAATRMFCDLAGRAEELWARRTELALAVGQPELPSPAEFARAIIERYKNLPKALVPFHREGGEVRTPLHEHLLDSALWLAGRNARAHFTVSPEWIERFEKESAEIASQIEIAHGTTIHPSFSIQDPATDTIAIDDSTGEPVEVDGRLLTRPSGHGALLQNLQECGGDLVVLKNIDNVLPQRDGTLVGRWHHVLAGMVAALQSQAHTLIRDLTAGYGDAIDRAASFVNDRLMMSPPSSSETRAWLIDRLDRPWRVCAVVENDGEPGGGPFWTRAGTLQIVESAQVDHTCEEQRRIWQAATHFNPVHLVCGLRRWTGEAFDLSAYANQEECIVTRKTFEGRNIRILERAGLWNGAMARWNTVFVEAPMETFAPVKTVFDLLRPAHNALDCGETSRNVERSHELRHQVFDAPVLRERAEGRHR